MDEIFNLINNYTPKTIILGSVLYLVKSYISDFNVTNLEQKLMTPNRKFIMVISKAAISSFVIVAICFYIIYDELIKIYKDNKELQPTFTFDEFILIFGINMILIMILFYLIMTYLMRFIEFIVGLNYDYEIEIDGRYWTIVRYNNQKQLVVEDGVKLKFIESPHQMEFKRKLASVEWKEKIYQDKKLIKNTYLVLLLATIIIVLSWYYTENLIFCILLILVLITIPIIFINVKEYEYYLKHSQ
ncbi:hypothetical protein ACPA0F_14045 [Solibacillus silvestris]